MNLNSVLKTAEASYKICIFREDVVRKCTAQKWFKNFALKKRRAFKHGFLCVFLFFAFKFVFNLRFMKISALI